MVATGQLISAIHDGPCQAVLAVTGGGSGALEQLLAVPGASRTVLEAVVPYCQPSLTDWLGGPVEQACSEPTARAMAMAAWLRARELTPEGDGAPLVGLGATASLATDRPKRGEQRIHVATQTATATRSLSLGLEKGRRTRTEEEGIASLVVLIALAEACGVDAAEALDELDSMLAKSERLERRECQAPTEWIELLAGERTWVVVGPEPNVSGGEDDGRGDASPVPVAMLSGAFHPPHDGHRQMAQMAEHLLGKTGGLGTIDSERRQTSARFPGDRRPHRCVAGGRSAATRRADLRRHVPREGRIVSQQPFRRGGRHDPADRRSALLWQQPGRAGRRRRPVGCRRVPTAGLRPAARMGGSRRSAICRFPQGCWPSATKCLPPSSGPISRRPSCERAGLGVVVLSRR